MAFVEEKLTEQDKEFIAGFQFEDPLTVGLADIPSEWVADRERGYYLIFLGGECWRSQSCYTTEYPPNYYRLILQNKVVEVEARIYGEGNYKTGVTVHWRLESIYVDKTIDMPEGELLKIVKEAFISDAILFHRGHAVKVCIDYVAEPYYTNI